MSLLDYWNTQLPVKRRKIARDDGLDIPSSRAASDRANERTPGNSSDTLDLDHVGEYPHEDDLPISSQTDLETSLPTVESDNEVIKEYEFSQTRYPETTLQDRLQNGRWQKGRSSIYVDAFNHALETVLEEESHLFNEAEMEVFHHWKNLSYESQYLYAL